MAVSENSRTGEKILSPIRTATSSTPVKLIVCAIAIGLLAGYGAVGFRIAIAEIQHLFYGFNSHDVVSQVADLPWWHIMGVPVIAGLIIGLFWKFILPGQRAQGVADVIEAVIVNRGKMKLIPGLGALFVSALTLGGGGSSGREGPVVHFCALIASQLGQRMRLPSKYYLTLIACGVSSGVAASFNAPIAGMFFALEVVVGSLATQAFAPIVIASVIGTVISRIYIGDFPAFIIPRYEIVTLWEFPAIALLGAVAALVSLIFIWSIKFSEKTIDRFHIPEVLRPAAGGLVLGGIAVFFPHIIGVGYEATDNALKGNYPLLLLLTLIVVKTIAVGITFGSRFGGGFFSPALFIGAMTGGAFGLIAATAFPQMAASHGLYAIIGMSAVAASVLGAPISTILIVFELTGDYKISIAVMVAVSVATLITKHLFGRSIWQTQLLNRNVDVNESRALRALSFRQVRGIMDREFIEVPKQTTMQELRKIISNTNHDKFVVVEPETHEFIGRIDYSDIKTGLFGDEPRENLTALDLVHENSPVLFPDTSLKSAVEIIEKAGIDHIPVINRAAERRLIGILHHKDLLHAYNAALLSAQDDARDKVFR
ncbi:chloride channel protein [uncultured Sneathiella sp.]|mgnify:FL=1|jgi:CIC family chloride channel protein|uniref:chloride channel protein n=1 Tax=uncultured Sneathiella sp. TaxID=879315 RepID=UPI0030DB0F27|tara:strand:+ start:49234 stop:51027 length:1794 start_codon:yes stop_codon:yes gene_type:complete